MRPTIENAKKQQDYIDSLQKQFGTLEPVDKSLREKSVDVATNVIGALPFGGGGDYYDRKIAKSLLGDYYEENIADSIGVADFTPLGLIYGVDEALREYGEAEKATDYILPTVGLGLSALEAFPLTEVGTRPLRRFLSNLSNKTSSGGIFNPDITRRTFMKGAGAAGVAAGTGALGGLLLKSSSEPIASNLDQLIGQFAKPIANTFETAEGFPFNVKPKRMEELIDKSSKASKEDAIRIRESMFDEMNFDQKRQYGMLQERVTRSVQIKALQDGAKISGDDKKYRFGAGAKSIAEPDDVNDISNTVFEIGEEFNSPINPENEIKLIDDFYNSLKKQGYSAQEIFDNPQIINKFEITTKGSPDFSQRMLSKISENKPSKNKSETMKLLDKIGSEGDIEEIGAEKMNQLIF
jgi:hypothetical protein